MFSSIGAPNPTLSILIVEAYDRGGRERLKSVGVRRASDTFASLLHKMAPWGHDIEIEFIQPTDSVAHIAEVGELERFDGVVWTGSSLTIHEDIPEVSRQIELARRCFEAGVPQYGSCWGLQISAAASGIPMEANPKGREHGVARSISLTPEGLRHPMFDGTMSKFDGLAAHTDQVAVDWARSQVCPPGVSAQVLATNDWSPVQAMSVRVGLGEFWSVQYHPELSLGDIARLMRLPVPMRLLTAQGTFGSEAELLQHADELEAIYDDPDDTLELRAKLGIRDDVLDPSRRSRELANWLQHLVVPTKARDLAHSRGPRHEPKTPKLRTSAGLHSPRAPKPSSAGASASALAAVSDTARSERAADLRAASGASPAALITVDNPFTGALAARVTMLETVDVVSQVVRSKEAQRQWAAETSLDERIALCGRFLDALEGDCERVATEISTCMGKPIGAARGEVLKVRERAEGMMAVAHEALAPERLPDKPNFARRIEKVPVGVVLCIAPWNYPLLTAVNCVVPAVLAGNSVQLKHSPRTPLAAEAFERAFAAAGAPEGLVQSLHCANHSIDAAIALPEVGFVSFTGSVGVGRAVHRSVSKRFIDSTLELGGKCAAYVAADADVAAAAASLVDGAFFNAGQSCCAIERVYCHASVHDEFVAHALELVRAYRIGDPLDPETSMGPLALPSGPLQLAAQVADATSKGARLLCGGAPTTDPASGLGRFFEPALLDKCHQQMSLMRDESFGPVLGVASVATDAEAAARMDDSAFGLTCAVFTADAERAEYIGARVRCGTVFMNRCDYLDPLLPWGGQKHSGKGVSLGGVHGFRALTKLKGFHLKMDPNL